LTIKEGGRCSFDFAEIVTLISMPAFPVDAVRHTMDELERIRTRKIGEMMSRSIKSQPSAVKRGPIEITDANFDATMKANPIVAVDCWAAWCYPCRMIAPIVEELAKEYGSAMTFAKLNVDENPSTAMKYNIQSIPTILIIKNEVEAERIIGAVPKEQIEAVLKKYL
jgi:thioredoxin